jgi:hypothetical protein
VVHPGFLHTPLQTPRSEHYRWWSGPGPLSRSQTGSVTHPRCESQLVSAASSSRSRQKEEAPCSEHKSGACRVSKCGFWQLHRTRSEAGCDVYIPLERGGMALSMDAERDEAIAPRHRMWSSPAVVHRRSALAVAHADNGPPVVVRLPVLNACKSRCA